MFPARSISGASSASSRSICPRPSSSPRPSRPRSPHGEDANIVNLLDPRVFRPEPGYFSYQISKSALLAATVALARAYAPRIRVNAIAPGPVVPSAHTTPERYASRINQLPLGRAPNLADFGRTVRYFVDNTSVTGEVIALDSGQHLA